MLKHIPITINHSKMSHRNQIISKIAYTTYYFGLYSWNVRLLNKYKSTQSIQYLKESCL